MRKIVFVGIFIVGLLVVFQSLVARVASAQTSDERLQQLAREIEQYQKEIDRLKTAANTLANQIAQFDAQIKLTSLKITETQGKIDLLGGRIDRLEVSLQSLSTAFSSRAVETYKMARAGEPLYILISAQDLSQAVARFHYLQKIQEADRDLLLRLQNAQNTYEVQKTAEEDLQNQLKTQKANLDAQKSAKAQLLAATKNNEKKYQQLLAQAQAELDAIQAIIAGKGTETEVGGIQEGSRIASVIPGASTCSSGAHLHFEVVKDRLNYNPADFLSSKSVIWDNAPDGPFGFGGSWSWPLNDPVRITQGYGMTYYAAVLKYYRGGPHTGIDMVDTNDWSVKAVKSGTLYRGSIGCGGGALRYVRVRHDDGYNTYYLHVNYL